MTHRDALESVIIETERIQALDAAINILTGWSLPRVISQLEKRREQARQDRAALEQQIRGRTT